VISPKKKDAFGFGNDELSANIFFKYCSSVILQQNNSVNIGVENKASCIISSFCCKMGDNSLSTHFMPVKITSDISNTIVLIVGLCIFNT
jgi:hypothetical protein